MADGFAPNPEVIVSGNITSVRERTYEGTAKGRILGILTRTGFVEVRVPVAHDALPFAVDTGVVLAVDLNFWQMPDEKTGLMRSGLVLGFTRHVTQIELVGLEAVAELVAA